MNNSNLLGQLTAPTTVGSGDWLGGKCPVCGKPNPRRHGEQKKTCGNECAKKLLKKMWQDKHAAMIHPKCPVCGGDNKKRRGKINKHCSAKCSAIAFSKSEHAKQFASTALANQPKAVARLRGSHGFGRMKQDNPNHASAKWYRLRSPDGRIYEIKNLRSFCHKNEQIFESDDRKFVNAVRPLWKRAADGLVSVSSGGSCSWFGWTAVCVFDIETDPLSRRVASPSNDKLTYRRE
jgi:predicted nucleic acid-binding Zn ribbon protein